MPTTGHDGPLCAQLGHYVASLAVIYCAHHQAWVCVIAAGDESDDTALEHRRINFGPFDSTDEVAEAMRSEVSYLVRVLPRVWAEQRRPTDDDAARTQGWG